MLSVFLNRKCLIIKTTYPFGEIDQTISHVLAVNYFANNLTKFGRCIVIILERFDKNHMNKSL